MPSRLRILAVCATIVAIAAGLIRLLQPVASGGGATEAPLATPPGITLHPVRPPGRTIPYGTPPPVAYADDRGMTLYVGPADCGGDCATRFPPARPPENWRPAGDWTVTPGADGAPQIALHGRRLHRFSGDAAPGEAKGEDQDGGGWSIAQFDPAAGFPLPDGITVRDQPNAGGLAFHDDRGRMLYARDDAPCAVGGSARWKPAAAPEIANPVGDFAMVQRRDGVAQWRYRGAPLFTFDGDLGPDDAKGAACGFRAALLIRYFVPQAVAIHTIPGLGDVLTDSAGMTLYARDRFIDADGHNFRTDHGAEATGRALGVAACDAACAKSWRPLAAPPDAAPSGYWDIYVRPDGTRQWAYKGYALYTFAGDARPGEANGNGSYALTPLGKDDHGAALAPVAIPVGGGAPSPGAGIGALFWRAAAP